MTGENLRVGDTATSGGRKMWLTWGYKEKRLRRIHFGCYLASMISSRYKKWLEGSSR